MRLSSLIRDHSRIFSGCRASKVLLWLALAMWPSAQLAQIFPPEVKKASEPFVCQCRCNHQLSACDMYGCGSAIPLREEIQEHLKQGKSQQQIIDAFVAKYGQNILSAPPKSAWVTPFAALSCGLILVFFVIKAWTQRKPKLVAASPAAPMPDAYRERLEKELKDLG
jgi:cytochrome c-type biogenesis protein CcmH/NrfF